jgi:hypothetical protein
MGSSVQEMTCNFGWYIAGFLHLALSILKFLVRNSVVPQLLYSPSLSPADFFLFLKWKCKRSLIESVEETQEKMLEQLFLNS